MWNNINIILNKTWKRILFIIEIPIFIVTIISLFKLFPNIYIVLSDKEIIYFCNEYREIYSDGRDISILDYIVIIFNAISQKTDGLAVCIKESYLGYNIIMIRIFSVLLFVLLFVQAIFWIIITKDKKIIRVFRRITDWLMVRNNTLDG